MRRFECNDRLGLCRAAHCPQSASGSVESSHHPLHVIRIVQSRADDAGRTCGDVSVPLTAEMTDKLDMG